MATLDDLVAALDDDASASTTTSVRQPVALRQALAIAVELGMATSGNDATNQSVRASLEAFALSRALEEHYTAHPAARPALYEVAQALAVMDRSPLAERPDLLQLAEREVLQHRPDADGDDVLLWALSLLQHEHSAATA
jgi:hypothetical protein